jgi:hypothetical protein
VDTAILRPDRTAAAGVPIVPLMMAQSGESI